MRTVRCQCGGAWVPEGMVCEQCEAFGDDAPLTMSIPDYTPEDRRIDAMDEEAASWKRFREMGCTNGGDDDEDEHKVAA